MDKTYTQQEVEVLVKTLGERQELLESLECACFIMTETKQYPRFINRLNILMKSIQGISEPEKKEEKVKTIQLVGGLTNKKVMIKPEPEKIDIEL
jgi:hypothetical protein